MGQETQTGRSGGILRVEEATPLDPREAELHALHAVGRSVMEGAPLEEILEQAAAAIESFMPADRISFVRVDVDRRVMSSLHLHGPGPRMWGEVPIPDGPIATALKTGAPVSGLIGREDQLWVAALYAEGLRSRIVVPLAVDGIVIGMCNISSTRPTLYSEREKATASRIATLAAVGIGASDARDAERRRAAELEALLRVSESVTRSLETDRVLAAAIEHSLDVTGLDAAALYLAHEDTGELELAVDRGLPEPFRGAVTRIRSGQSVVGTVFAEAQPRLVRNLTTDPVFRFKEQLAASGVETASVVAAPLIWDDRVIGCMAMWRFSSQSLGRRDLSFLIALSRPVAVALGNSRLYESLRQVSAMRRRLLGDLVDAQQQERKAIAEDIHDDTVQVMTAVGMRLNILRRQLLEEAQLDVVYAAERSVTDAVERLRTLMFELHPGSLGRNGLDLGLRLYLEQTFAKTELSWELDDRLRKEPSPVIRAMLYRVVVEALNNVRKHARARRVQMELRDLDDGVFVRIRDDGVGFSTTEIPESPRGHLGISSIRERAGMAGGWCRIESEPGIGTTVECWMPSGELEGVA